VPHDPRPWHEAAHPVHVTLRAGREAGHLRLAKVFPALRDALRAASMPRFRVVHFSVQSNHVHLIIEAETRQALIRGVQGLAMRLARTINRCRARRGPACADRYHARALTTPREVRNALLYVLNNFKKHDTRARGIDLCSSGPRRRLVPPAAHAAAGRREAGEPAGDLAADDRLAPTRSDSRRRATARVTGMADLELEPTGIQELGPCTCCGDRTRRVWGFVHRGDTTEAAYFVEWAPGKVAGHGAHVDLIVGNWGEGAGATDRVAVALEFRRTDRGPSFMVIDATGRSLASSELAGASLRREEVVGAPLAKRVFEIVDAIWLQDGRIREVTGRAP
jgi:REP element-mobilizing transposase RayT